MQHKGELCNIKVQLSMQYKWPLFMPDKGARGNQFTVFCDMIRRLCNIPILMQYSYTYAIFLYLCNIPILVQYSYTCAIFLYLCNIPILMQYSYTYAIFLYLCNIPILPP